MVAAAARGLRLAPVLLVACGVWLGGCAQPVHLQGSRERTEAWAEARGWTAQALPGAQFRLLALLRQRAVTRVLTVYIEGDGAPWPSAYSPPRDPTPRRPLAMQLAERDPAVAVAYLGRPCQYLSATELADCSPLHWTRRRFAPEVLRAMDEAVEALRLRAGATRLRLVGYSGGGVLATLLAQRRADVESLVTLAAPLALNEWTRLMGLAPLDGSLDPLEGDGPHVPALYLAGEDDRIVPVAVAERFVARHGGRLERLPGFDHGCCWLRHWPALLPLKEVRP